MLMNSGESQYHFDIIAFRATDQASWCKNYIEGHQKVLKDFGIENITSNVDWTKNPNMFCFVAIEKESSKMLGGIRIQVADGKNHLPVELAIGKIDPNIFEKVKYYKQNGGVGELCGLWIENSIRKIGLSVFLIRAAIAASIQLNFQTMIGICSPYSLKMFENVGFVIDYDLGSAGNFNYPNEKYIANVVGILNTISLEHAALEDKLVMLKLRKELNLIYILENLGIKSKLNVSLIIN